VSVVSESVNQVIGAGFFYDRCDCPVCRSIRDGLKALAEVESLRKANAELRACNDRQCKTVELYMGQAEKLRAENLGLSAELAGRRCQAKAQEQVIAERDDEIELIRRGAKVMAAERNEALARLAVLTASRQTGLTEIFWTISR
jgi:hypothetical protein